MALEKQIVAPMLVTQTPAYLILGSHDLAVAYTQQLLQQLLCPHNGCATCITCRHIAEHQHHQIIWLLPEKMYTLDEIDIIFSTLAFALEPGQLFFFVIQKADRLPSACANRLLKSLEEPPPGYHFILLTDRLEQLLPTIRSRCVMHMLSGYAPSQAHAQLISWFTASTHINPATFLSYLDKEAVAEQETIPLLDIILTHWANQYKKLIGTGDPKEISAVEKKITILRKAYTYLPMPGSGKIFWKNLFLQLLTNPF